MRRRWSHAAWLAAVVAAGACAPRPGAAAEAPAWLGEVSLNGFLATSYSYNFNRPATGTNQLRVFDFDDNTFKLDVVELVAQKPVAKLRDAGFRVDVTFGSSIPRVTASSGLFRDAAGTAEDIDAHQAFVSWMAPVGSGLRLDLGKFITSFGYEVIDGYDNWNDNATRSLLFGFAIPFAHVGARAAYTLSPRATVQAMVVNGWDVARDNNRSKSVGGQLALTPTPPLSLVLTGMWGPERTADDGDPRTLLDAVAILRAGTRWTLGANADWGVDADGAGPGQDARWSGVAGYVRLGVTPIFALTARAESFDDRDGVRTGVAQSLSEVTLTPELRLTPHLLVRGDARVDRSNHRVFLEDAGVTDTQPTILLEALYSF